MRRLLLLLFITTQFFASAQSYVKLVPTRDTSNICNIAVDMIPYGGTVGPYVITWWDNYWQPSTGFRAENLCVGTVISTELIDMNCRHLRNNIYILPHSIPQVYLDTVIAILPSIPGGCDGSISFHFRNVTSPYTRHFASSSSGGVVSDSAFYNLCEDDYSYSIYGPHLTQSGSVVYGEVSVSLHYPPVLPCEPFRDSLVLTPQSSPGACDATITYNSSGAAATLPYYHSIYKPVNGGSVQVNPGPIDLNPSFNNLCSGPHIVRTQTFLNNNYYFVSSTIFVDNPLLNDSVWGTPGSSQIDTVLLSAITNCGVNYAFNVDSVYISKMDYIANNQYNIEITVLQIDSLFNQDTIRSYETAIVDTSHQLCFDFTFFCADSSNMKTVSNEIHNYIYYPANGGVTSLPERRLKFSLVELYPNPTSSSLMVSNLPSGENRITLMTVDGKILQNISVTAINYKIILESISSGLYFLRIENGTDVAVKRFVVNKE